MCGKNEVIITEDQQCELLNVKAATDTIIDLLKFGIRTPQSVQTHVYFYLLNKLLWCVGIILLVEFSK